MDERNTDKAAGELGLGCELSECASAPAWLLPNEKKTPLWLRTLYASLPIAAICILHGEIHDLHPVRLDGRLRPDTTTNAIWYVLEQSGFQGLLRFDPIEGLTISNVAKDWDVGRIRNALASLVGDSVASDLLLTPAQRADRAQTSAGCAPTMFDGMDAVVGAVAQSEDPSLALVIDYTSQVRSDGMGDDEALKRLMLASFSLATEHALHNREPIRFAHGERGGTLRHPIIWLIDKLDDLPVWLTCGDGIRQIAITKPDVDTRRDVAQLLIGPYAGDGDAENVITRFADATEGLSMRGMFESVQLARSTDSVVDNIEGAVRTYREGLSDNPWQSPRLREKLMEGSDILRQRVLGQEAAVARVLDILKRSALGLTGAHQKKKATAPRGVLYFAGPTGVGKTEMAKAIAELVFSDEQSLLRFDMSEFQDEHAKIRLVGAPPSYVGYGSGGELTNAVQKRPNSIILFDEMDKAGRSVNDLFLQILSDGRLTDGSGRTALFNESIIIFTSNQGVAAAKGLEGLDMDVPEQARQYEAIILDAVKRHFKETLGRPELLGRLGDNIVVFHPMHGKVAERLAEGFIDTILGNVRIRVGNVVSLSADARTALVKAVTTPEYLANGGRGITMALEERLVNPLGRILFAVDQNTRLEITGIGLDGDGGACLYKRELP